MFVPFFKQIKILIYSSITKKFLTAEEELAKTLYIQRDFLHLKSTLLKQSRSLMKIF